MTSIHRNPNGHRTRNAILMCVALLFVLGSACDQGVTVLVQYGCNDEDLIVETWNGVTATEVARFAPGRAPVCFSIGKSKVSMLYSRCESNAVAVPISIGVFDPDLECNR